MDGCLDEKKAPHRAVATVGRNVLFSRGDALIFGHTAIRPYGHSALRPFSSSAIRPFGQRQSLTRNAPCSGP